VKTWQIFGVGVLAAIALWAFPLYQSFIAGAAATTVIGIVAAGFYLCPRTDVFYIRTTVWRMDLDHHLSAEHEQLAVKVEVARLWLLFVPTALAVSFLVITAVNGTLWSTGVFDWVEHGYVFPIIDRTAIALIVFALPIWISERRVLRNADACSALRVSVDNGYVGFSFVDRSGEVYAGEGFRFGRVRPPELATVVLYATRKPDLSKIGMCLLFHRLIIIGRGLTDLDKAEATARTVLAETTS
jgi:hypothetical protein